MMTTTRPPTQLNALLTGMPAAKTRSRFPAFWSPGAALPDAPDGYVFPVDAFNKAGRALDPDNWTGDEMRIGSLAWGLLPELSNAAFEATGERGDDHSHLEANYHAARSALTAAAIDVPAYTPKFRKADYEEVRALGQEFRTEWVRARLFRDMILRSLCRAAASGDMKSVIRPKGSGEEQPMERRFWKTDDYAKRFIPCTINPDFPDDEMAEQTHRFFLDEAGLDRVIERMVHKDIPAPSQLSGVHLSPYLQMMIEVARASDIGPLLQDQPSADELNYQILEANKRFNLSLSPTDIKKMATFIREPYLKGVGMRTALARDKEAKAREQQGEPK